MKKTLALLALLLAALFLFAACELKPAAPFQLGPYREGGGGRTLLEGSGRMETKTVALPVETESFALEVTGISFQGLGKAEAGIVVDESLERAVVLEADDNITARIDIRVDGAGNITAEADRKTVIVSPTRLQLRVGAPVSKVVINGAWKLEYDCPGVTECDVELNGAANGNFKFDALDTLRVDINGAGNCVFSGTARRAAITLNGAAQVSAFDLYAREAAVTINGASSCEITVEENLRAEINGVGTIVYDGEPEVKRAVHGLGSVRKR